MIKPKIVLDKELTNNLQVIVRDETGIYNPSNEGGYGGPNGNPSSSINKYIFELINKNTGAKYTQIQSDDVDNPNEYYNPSVGRIVNKENVTIDSNNFDLTNFEDGLYQINMNVKMNYIYFGDGFKDANVIVNVQGVETLFNNYKHIIVGSEIYEVQAIVDTTLVLDRDIVSTFSEFVPIIKSNVNFLLSDTLKDCLNNSIASLSGNCCETDIKSINIISEIQTYLWSMYRTYDQGDIIQATEYFNMAKNLCQSLNCGCNGGGS